MKINSVTTLFFSPTGGTKRIATVLADRIAFRLSVPVISYDITLPKDRAKPLSFEADTLLVTVFPTYAGKLPNKILPDIKRILSNGCGQPVAAIVTFGNRNFDNSLAELFDLLNRGGFFPIAGAAFICEHPFSKKLGTMRPDSTDFNDIDKFASILQDRLSEFPREKLQIPGDADAPYYTPLGEDGEPAGFLKATPFTIKDSCFNCGKCAACCPVSSIDPKDTSKNTGPCIKCHACIKICPVMAKSFTDPDFLSHVAYLEKHFASRKAPTFI